MNDLPPENVDSNASAINGQEEPNLMMAIYEPFAGCIYGLICKILPDAETAEETFEEVMIFIVSHLSGYDHRRYSKLNWVMNTTRIIAIKNRHMPDQRNAGTALFENFKIHERAILEMYYADELPENLISDNLCLPIVYVQLVLKRAKYIRLPVSVGQF